MNEVKSVPLKRPEFKNSGIRSQTLVSQVQNTAPFLFALNDSALPSNQGYVTILKSALKSAPEENDLWSYFELCLASHFASVGTFVPTDVDSAIRLKLWAPVHSEVTFLPMWEKVQEFQHWDETLVSHRQVITVKGRKLSGHQGEWFTIAMGAYGCAHRAAKEYLMEIRSAIEDEVQNQEIALQELRTAFSDAQNIVNMKAYLSGVAAVAHNLGDLDRMFDAWEIEDTDVLKRRVFRSGHEDARNPKPILIEAGRVYQNILSTENHRNFALRVPKALRKSEQFLLPFGLFLDDWGLNLVQKGFQSNLLNEGELREIVEALIQGWKKLNPVSIYTSQGYSRALVGIAKGIGRSELEALVPPVLRKELTEGGLRTLMSVSQSDFEKKMLTKLKVELNRS